MAARVGSDAGQRAPWWDTYYLLRIILDLAPQRAAGGPGQGSVVLIGLMGTLSFLVAFSP